MYSIVTSFINIISKAVIKYLYDVGKFSSNVTTMSSSPTGTSKHIYEPTRKCFDLVDVVQQEVVLFHIACEEQLVNEEDVG